MLTDICIFALSIVCIWLSICISNIHANMSKFAKVARGLAEILEAVLLAQAKALEKKEIK